MSLKVRINQDERMCASVYEYMCMNTYCRWVVLQLDFTVLQLDYTIPSLTV